MYAHTQYCKMFWINASIFYVIINPKIVDQISAQTLVSVKNVILQSDSQVPKSVSQYRAGSTATFCFVHIHVLYIMILLFPVVPGYRWRDYSAMAVIMVGLAFGLQHFYKVGAPPPLPPEPQRSSSQFMCYLFQRLLCKATWSETRVIKEQGDGGCCASCPMDAYRLGCRDLGDRTQYPFHVPTGPKNNFSYNQEKIIMALKVDN